VCLDEGNVLSVVVAISLLDRVEDVEALLELFVKLHVVDGLGHLLDFAGQLILLAVCYCVKVVTTGS